MEIPLGLWVSLLDSAWPAPVDFPWFPSCALEPLNGCRPVSGPGKRTRKRSEIDNPCLAQMRVLSGAFLPGNLFEFRSPSGLDSRRSRHRRRRVCEPCRRPQGTILGRLLIWTGRLGSAAFQSSRWLGQLVAASFLDSPLTPPEWPYGFTECPGQTLAVEDPGRGCKPRHAPVTGQRRRDRRRILPRPEARAHSR